MISEKIINKNNTKWFTRSCSYICRSSVFMKKTCVLTEICCVLLVYTFPDLVWWSLLNGVPNVLYMPTRPTCSTCPTRPRVLRAQVYFTDRKIKKWKFCTHMFLRVLSLILGLNFRNYRFIQTREKFQIEFFSYNKLTFCSNNVSFNVLQQPYISIWI